MSPRSPAAPPLSEIIPRTRVDSSLLDALAACKAKWERDRPGEQVTLAGLLRALLWRALSAEGFAPPTDASERAA